MKEFPRRRAVHIFMLLLVVFAMTMFVACKDTGNTDGKNDKKIGLSIEYTEKTWYEGDVFEVPSYTTEAEGASVAVSYTIDGGSDILALVGSNVDLYVGEYVFTYKATLTGYAAEEKTISFTVEEQGVDPLQTVSVDGFTGPVYKTDVYALDDFTVPTGSVSEGSTLKITMTDPQGAAKTVTGGQSVYIDHSGDYVFTYEAVHSNPSYKNKKIDLTVTSSYKGLVGDFENFAITPDVAESGYITIQSEIKHDGQNALRLRTSGNDRFPRNRPQVEQVNYQTSSRFGTIAPDANTVSFWIYPTTDDVLLLSLGFCHSDNWLTWHPNKEFKNNALLIGSLEPNQWHYVSLPLPEQFDETVFGYGLTHFGVFVLADKDYDTYYNYRDLSEIGGDSSWIDDDGVKHNNTDDYWEKGPQEEVLTYIDSVCFTNDPDWNCDKAFKTVTPNVSKQYQTYVVDYLAQTDAKISVSYKINDDEEEHTTDNGGDAITKGSEISLDEAGTYTFTYKVLDRTDETTVIYKTTQKFAIEAVSNEILIPKYDGTTYTDTIDTLSDFIVPVGTAKQQDATVTIKMTTPAGTTTTVEAGDVIKLELIGDYTFLYEAEYESVSLGTKTLTITSRYKGLVADFEDGINTPSAEFVSVSNEKAHDGAKSFKLVTRASSESGWPWNRPRAEDAQLSISTQGANTVSFWIYPTTGHALLLNLGFAGDGLKHALYIGKLSIDKWHYVSLPLPNEIISHPNKTILHLGIYVLDDTVVYDSYYNYQNEAGICNESGGPNVGPDRRVTVYLDTLCFTNDPDWNCDKAFKTVAPTVSKQYQTYVVDYLAQTGANISISYKINDGAEITVDKNGDAITKGSEISLDEAGTYTFTYKVLDRTDGTTVIYQTTQSFEIEAVSRAVMIEGYEYEGTDYTDTKRTMRDFTVPVGTSQQQGATITITMTDPKGTAKEVQAGENVKLEWTGDYTFLYEAEYNGETLGSKTLTITSAYEGLVADFENFTVGGDLPGEWVTVSGEKAREGTKSLKLVSNAGDAWPWNRPRLEQWSGTQLYVNSQANTVSFWIFPTTDHKLYLDIGFGDTFQNNALKIGTLTKNQWNYVSLRLPENFTSDKLSSRLQCFGVYVLSEDNAYDEYYNNQNTDEIFKKGPNEEVTVYIDNVCFTVEEYAG